MRVYLDSLFTEGRVRTMGRLLIDAAIPAGRREQYERKRVPGAASLRLSDYFS
jgi:hypothetical protein